ncbi:flippase [Candidatus Woesearchaeota archaeon]|nr:flippase [Candidatus Woesearchaeota archaeon]
MSYTQKAIKGIMAVSLSTFLSGVFGYLARILLARSLTTAELGLFYSLFTVLMFILIFVDMGYSTAIVKHIAQNITEKKKEMGGAIRIVMGIQLGIALIIGTTLIISADWQAAHYFHDPSVIVPLKIFVGILIIKVLINFIPSIFAGLQYMGIVSVLRFLDRFLFLMLVYVLLLLGLEKSTLLPTYAYFITVAILLVVQLILLHKYKLIPLITQSIRSTRKEFFSLSHFAFFSMFTAVGGIIIGYIDTLMLTYFVPMSDVGIYNTVLPTVLILSTTATAISTVFFPMVSELWAKKDLNRITWGIVKLYNYSFWIMVPLGMIMFIFPQEIILLLFGSDYLSGVRAMQILAIGALVLSLNAINQASLNGLGKPEKITKIYVIAALFNFFGNLLLIPRYGIVGAAVTTTISYFLILILSTYMLYRVIPFSNQFWHSWIKTLIAGVLFIGIVSFLKYYLTLNMYAEALITITVAGIGYLVITHLFKIWNLQELRSTIALITRKKNA